MRTARKIEIAALICLGLTTTGLLSERAFRYGIQTERAAQGIAAKALAAKSIQHSARTLANAIKDGVTYEEFRSLAFAFKTNSSSAEMVLTQSARESLETTRSLLNDLDFIWERNIHSKGFGVYRTPRAEEILKKNFTTAELDLIADEFPTVFNSSRAARLLLHKTRTTLDRLVTDFENPQ